MGGRRLSSGRLENLLENLKREIKLRPSTKLNWEAQNASNSGEYTHGAGMVGTNGSCEVFVHEVGREIVTTVEIDLTGLKKKSDEGDAIGVDGTDGSYLFQYKKATHGIFYRIEIITLELPTAASNVLLDFDIISQSAADVAYDDDISGGTALFTMGGNVAVNAIQTDEAITVQPTESHYLCLADGATSTATDVFTGGKLIIKFYGRHDINT
jgi:hypothetical protein